MKKIIEKFLQAFGAGSVVTIAIVVLATIVWFYWFLFTYLGLHPDWLR